jgi:hypothetical protein
MDGKKAGRTLMDLVNYDLWNATPNRWTLCRIRSAFRENGVPELPPEEFRTRVLRYFKNRERGGDAELFRSLFSAPLDSSLRAGIAFSYAGAEVDLVRIDQIAVRILGLVSDWIQSDEGTLEPLHFPDANELRVALTSLYRLPFHATTDHFPFERIRYEILRAGRLARSDEGLALLRQGLEWLDPAASTPERGAPLQLTHSLTQAEHDWLGELVEFTSHVGRTGHLFPRLKGTRPVSDQEVHPDLRELLILTRRYNLRIGKGELIPLEFEERIRTVVSKKVEELRGKHEDRGVDRSRDERRERRDDFPRKRGTVGESPDRGSRDP